MSNNGRRDRLRILAGSALEGLLAKYGFNTPPHLIGQKAVEYAESTLAELEKKDGNDSDGEEQGG